MHVITKIYVFFFVADLSTIRGRFELTAIVESELFSLFFGVILLCIYVYRDVQLF